MRARLSNATQSRIDRLNVASSLIARHQWAFVLLWGLGLCAKGLAACPAPSSSPIYACSGGVCVNGTTSSCSANFCPATGSVNKYAACSIANYDACLAPLFGNLSLTSVQTVPFQGQLYPTIFFRSRAGTYDSILVPSASGVGCATSDRNLGPSKPPSGGGATVGEPIDTSWGNEYEDEADFSATAPYPLVFHRYYNSFGLGDSTMGARWTHTFSRSVVQQTGTLVQLFRDQGEILYFNQCSTGWCANADEIGTLTQAVDSNGFTTGWTYVDENDVVEAYSAAGQLLSETARGGVVHTMAYDSSGRLSTITDSFGRTLTLSYNAANQIAQISDPNGLLYQYTYDASNNLQTVTYPDAAVRTYLYNESGYVASGAAANLLTGIQDENGQRYVSIHYDSQSRATQSTLAGGARNTQVTYNTSGTATISDALGASRTFTFSTILSRNHLSSISGGACAECGIYSDYDYDVNGNISAATDLNGNRTTHSFDLTRNLELSRTEGLTSSGASTSSTRTIATQWWPSYREPQQISVYSGATATGTAVRSTSFTYDSAGNMLTKTVTDPATSSSRTWTYTYDGYGRVLTAKGPRTDVNSTTTYQYYTCTTGVQCGEVQTATDPVGNITTYNTYNAYGQPLTITDPNGVVTTLTYDARQRLTSRQVGSETVTFTYWPTGLLKQVTLPDTSYLLYTYDNAHRLTQISDGLSNSIHYTLDAMDNSIAENVYDPSNTLHRTHARVFNALNQLYQDVNAAGTAAVTTTFGYDSNGNQTSIAAPMGRNTGNVYDALNRLAQITDPAAGITQFGYDVNDNLTSVTDPRTLVTSYSYNGLGDLGTQLSPDTGTTTNTYDSAGNLATLTDARNAVATYSYDPRNRVASVAYSLSGVTDQTISFTYDAGTYGKGHLTGASDANHSLGWNYDGLGRVVSKTQTVSGISLSVGYGYTQGDLTTITTPSGQTITYGYNTNHQVTSLAVNGTGVLNSVTYEPLGPVNGWSWGNGTAATRAYDADGKITGIVSNGAKTLSYDDAFRITGITDTSAGASNWTYGYDALDRLTSGSSSSVARGWTYDANGNRLTETGSAPSTYSIAPTSNRITGITGTLARSYSYDAVGNTLTYASATATYNNAGRLETLSQGGSTETLVYNALGQRIEKTGGTGGTVLYWYDEAGHLLGEYDGSGALIEETVWLGDVPVATLRPNGSAVSIYYVHSDQLNTPRQVTRPSDNAQMWTWFSDPFGTDGANANPGGIGAFPYNLRFPGQVFDGQAGLHDNYFRDYDPAIGRYAESDPIGLGGGINTYTYANENPLSVTDSLGLMGFGGGGSTSQGNGGANGCSDDDHCEEQVLKDEAVCRSLPDKAVRSRCWSSANERYGACRAKRPLPPLVTWREALPLPVPAPTPAPALPIRPVAPAPSPGVPVRPVLPPFEELPIFP